MIEYEKTHFCFVLPKFAPENIGGAELQVLYLAKELIARGSKVSYVRENSSQRVSTRFFEGIRLYAIPNIKYFFLQWLNAPSLLITMSKVDADVYYSRVSKSYLPILVLGSWLFGGRVFWACSHDRESERFVFRTKSPIKWVFESFEHRIFKWGIFKAVSRFVQSTYQENQLQNNYGLSSTVLENAHPVPPWRDGKDRKNQVLWVANFRDFKRPELFLELVQRMKELPFDFLMVGKVNDAKYQNLIEQAKRVNPRFDFCGSLPVVEVEELFWNTKVFVNTSSQEGFPNTFIQSLMRGVPIMSLQVDPAGIISQNDLGLVESNINRFDEFLVKIMEDDILWTTLSNNCRLFAESRFSIRSYTDIFLKNIS